MNYRSFLSPGTPVILIAVTATRLVMIMNPKPHHLKLLIHSLTMLKKNSMTEKNM